LASFFLATSSNITQTLTTGQTGIVALGVTLFQPARTAVSSSGDSTLAVLGAAGAGTGAALSNTSAVNNADHRCGIAGHRFGFVAQFGNDLGRDFPGGKAVTVW